MHAQEQGRRANHGACEASELYERLVTRFVSRLAACRSRSTQQLWGSLDAACAELSPERAAPDEPVRLLRDCVGRDLSHVASVLVRGTRDDTAMIARLAQQPGPLPLLVHALRLSGDGIFRIAGESGRVESRRSGEVTCAGTLACLQCGSKRRSTRALVVRDCFECGHGEFSKTFRA